MGTAREELIELLNKDVLYGMCRLFGRFGLIQVVVTDVTPDRLTVSVRTRRELKGAPLAENVRNGIINELHDLLPVRGFRAVYDNPKLGITAEVHDLLYGEALSGVPLRSSVIVIEDLLAPKREKMREPIRRLWQRLLSEDRRTPGELPVERQA